MAGRILLPKASRRASIASLLVIQLPVFSWRRQFLENFRAVKCSNVSFFMFTLFPLVYFAVNSFSASVKVVVSLFPSKSGKPELSVARCHFYYNMGSTVHDTYDIVLAYLFFSLHPLAYSVNMRGLRSLHLWPEALILASK